MTISHLKWAAFAIGATIAAGCGRSSPESADSGDGSVGGLQDAGNVRREEGGPQDAGNAGSGDSDVAGLQDAGSGDSDVAGLQDAGSGDGGAGDEEDGGGTPTISITSPVPGATVPVTQPLQSYSKVVTIDFTVMNFTLMTFGACPGGGMSVACGQVLVYVDGSACTPPGTSYNSAATAGGQVDAILSSCPTLDGSHTVSLELYKDDGSPVDGPDGMVISAQVTFNVSGG